LGGCEFVVGDNGAVCIFAEGPEFGTENDIENLLNFESRFGSRGPETILGRVELGEDDSLPDIFGD